MDACQKKRSPQLAEVRPDSSLEMPKSDKVPCFLTGMDSSWEKPAQILSRADARGLKTFNLGKFENHGQTFRLYQTIKEEVIAWIDGPLGIGHLIPFAKRQNPNMAPEHLHYRIPAVADRAGHFGHCMSARATNKPPQLLFPLPTMAEAYS